MTGERAPAQKTPIDREVKLALAAMALGIFVIANDFTALSVAIPEIEKTFDTDLTRAQWVINGYALVFGVLIVTGGRLADLYGRKRMFMVGAGVFATFSFVSGVAPDVYTLIIGRGLMGVGGALMWPAVLGIIYSLLPQDRSGLAGGLLMGVCGIGNAFGPLLGGFLTDVLSWRWIFFVNVPVAACAMWVTWRRVPESRADSTERQLDYVGVALLSTAIVAVLVALDEAPEKGFGDPLILGLLALGAVLLAVFMVVERREGDRALLPSRVLHNRVFALACLSILMMSALFFAVLVYLPQFFTHVLGWSPLGSGAGLLPMMLVFAATSFTAGPLYDKLGARVVVGSGAAALALGMFLLALIDADSEYVVLIPGMIVIGVGVGLFYSSITTVAVTALDPSQSSLAGGVAYMCQIAGGAVGLGINTAIVASADDLTAGIGRAFVVDGVLAVLGFVVVLRALSSHEPQQARHHLRWHRAHA